MSSRRLDDDDVVVTVCRTNVEKEGWILSAKKKVYFS